MMIANGTCCHTFCTLCISKHVAAKVEENTIAVPCPGLECTTFVELETCRGILPQDVVSRWETAKCEALFLHSQKLYCPFRDCSRMLVIDCESSSRSSSMIRECECPYCHRMFCAQCYVTWHGGVTCEEYQSLNEDERGREGLMLRELAHHNKWGRCPKCKFYVERTEGCPHILFRCKFEFCYGCGAPWDGNHGGCSRS